MLLSNSLWPVNIQSKDRSGRPSWPARQIGSCHRLLGDHSERDPPVPIPNTAVKPLSPDGTARASVWESRKLPGLKSPGLKSPKAPEKSGLFCYFAHVSL